MECLSFRSALEHPIAELAGVMNRAFDGYVGGTVEITPERFAGLCHRDEVDLARSLVAVRGNEPLAFALLARRGATGRLAAMGVVPEAKGKGVGTALLGAFVEGARARGDRALELETFAENPPAVSLYRRHGFETIQKLVGYTLDEAPAAALAAGVPSAGVEEIGPVVVARAIVVHGDDDLPWQVTGEAVVRSAPPDVGLAHGEACALVTPPGEVIVLRAIVTARPGRRKGHARALVASIAARWPGRKIVVVPVWPAAIGETILAPLGFRAQRLHQLRMRRAL